MFYRIVDGPPGYVDLKGFMIVAYTTLEYRSFYGDIHASNGEVYFNTIEEARLAIPGSAVQLPFRQEDQFIELWESPSTDGLVYTIRWPGMAQISGPPFRFSNADAG